MTEKTETKPEPAKPSAFVQRVEGVRALLTDPRFLAIVKDALPTGSALSPERLAWTALNTIEQPNEKGKYPLMHCTDRSLRRAVLKAAEVGIEFFGGKAYLIPYGREATFQMGVWGYVDLAYRGGNIVRVWSDVIYESDTYEVVRGAAPKLVHDVSESWHRRGDNVDYDHQRVVSIADGGRGKPLGAYACAELKDGRVLWEVVPEAQCQMARSVSKSKNGPGYSKWPDEMRRRTAFNRAQKTWPTVDDMRRAVELEERDDLRGDLATKLQAIETAGESLPSDTGGALDRAMAARQGPVAALPDPASMPPAASEAFDEPADEQALVAEDGEREPGEEG